MVVTTRTEFENADSRGPEQQKQDKFYLRTLCFKLIHRSFVWAYRD